jgi:hypothetical protein
MVLEAVLRTGDGTAGAGVATLLATFLVATPQLEQHQRLGRRLAAAATGVKSTALDN